MKKTILRTVSYVLCLAFLLTLMSVTAAAAPTASFTGSSSIKAGESVRLTLSVDGKIQGLTGKLHYGSGLIYTNYDPGVAGWSMDVNNTNFIVYGSSAASGSMIIITLKVDSTAAAGSALSASFSDITVTDGEKEYNLGTASWSGTVAAPPSGDNALASLSCGNATLSPAFSRNTTNYTCTVPYSVTALDLKYSKSDSNASVSVSGNALEVGDNTVTLTVTAANGAVKYYTITATRETDPDYKPSTDATLSELTIEGTTLSPAFRPEVLEYVAYVPFETREVTLHGTPADEKALGASDKTAALSQEGDTPVTLVCTAEDGTTTKEYLVHVYRMPLYAGGNLLVEVSDPDAEPPEPEIPTAQVPLLITLPLVGEVSTLTAGCVALGAAVILLFLLGFLIGRSGRKNSNEPDREKDDSFEEDVPEPIYELRPAVKKEELPAPKKAPEAPSPAPEKAAELPEEPKDAVPEERNVQEKAPEEQEMSLDELLDFVHKL